jgi:hypothetical protein
MVLHLCGRVGRRLSLFLKFIQGLKPHIYRYEVFFYINLK